MLDIKHEDGENCQYMQLIGRLGAANSVEIGAKLVLMLEQGPGLLHLNLSELTFLDSSGLSVFVSLLKRARENSGDVVLWDMNDRIRTLFELTRLHEVFEIRNNSDPEQLRMAS